MIDLGTILWLLAGFGFLFAAAALAGAGTDPFLTGLFPQNDKHDWPRGVQETDVPRFAVEHLDALRPARPRATTHQQAVPAPH
jgi:hypothetical protein